MSTKSINVYGLIGIFILILGTLLNLINNIKFNAVITLYVSLISILGALFLFISLYKCFEFTESSTIGCRINLVGVFSIIPILAFNVFRFLEEIFPSLSTYPSASILLGSFLFMSNALLTLFLFSIYNKHITHRLNNLSCKLMLVLSIILLVSNIIYHVMCNVLGSPYFNLKFITEISIWHNLILLIFYFTLLITYRKFLDELKSVSDVTKDNNLYITV